MAPRALVSITSNTLGVGIDLEELDAVDHLSPSTVRRAAARWLRAHERAWCESQVSFRSSLVVVLCCKEAVFKASRGTCPAHQISLSMGGTLEAGGAMWDQTASVTIHVAWLIARGTVLALAAGQQRGAPAVLLEQLLCERGFLSFLGTQRGINGPPSPVERSAPPRNPLL